MPASCVIAALRPEFLRSLKRTLEPEFEVVAMADNPVSLQDSTQALGPDLAVVDLELLGASPWKQVSMLRRHSPGVSLIVLADVADDDPRAREAGVDRILVRSSAGTLLVPAAREVVNR